MGDHLSLAGTEPIETWARRNCRTPFTVVGVSPDPPSAALSSTTPKVGVEAWVAPGGTLKLSAMIFQRLYKVLSVAIRVPKVEGVNGVVSIPPAPAVAIEHLSLTTIMSVPRLPEVRLFPVFPERLLCDLFGIMGRDLRHFCLPHNTGFKG